ncbi:MAG: hypothetical protein IT537_16980 [Hyphomicrobiales bacterium]|nr:hypothetical protein [Hyphomicrobiales bacterium]
MIEARFVDAADVMKHLLACADLSVSTADHLSRAFADRAGQEPPRLPRPPPFFAASIRMGKGDARLAGDA